MKKIFRIGLIMVMLLPMYANAYSTNMTGNVIETSTGGSSASSNCGYYIGFTQAGYMFYGLRITFYDENFKQVGQTVDVWVWKDLFARNWASVINKKPVSTDTELQFSKYSVNARIGEGTPSKVDYISGQKNFLRTKSATYNFYYDNYARKLAGKNENSNPLFYTTQVNRTLLKEYLTTEEVMVRYLKLAGAYSYVNVKEGNYTMVLEPVISLAATDSCSRNEAYTGRYSVTEIGYMLREVKSISKKSLLKNLPQYLQLEKQMTISGIAFSPIVGSTNRYYTKEEMTSTLGVGIGTIEGTEVCKQNCISKNKYKVVYHTIDIANPFLNKDGTIRQLSEESNWYGNEKTSTIDANIYSKTPFLTVTLTPTTIKAIRAEKLQYGAITQATYEQFKRNYASILKFG